MDTAPPANVLRVLEGVNEFAVAGHRKWLNLCYSFLAWERNALMLGEKEIKTGDGKEHGKALLYLLKTTEFLAGIDQNDPDLETLRWRLNESWELICNKPSPEESLRLRKMMAGAFPQ